MNLAGIMHRPDSEMAYVVNEQTVNIRLRTAKDDIVNVELLAGDPYSLRSLPTDEKFYQVPKQMTKIMSDGISDFPAVSRHRLSGLFDPDGAWHDDDASIGGVAAVQTPAFCARGWLAPGGEEPRGKLPVTQKGQLA